MFFFLYRVLLIKRKHKVFISDYSIKPTTHPSNHPPTHPFIHPSCTLLSKPAGDPHPMPGHLDPFNAREPSQSHFIILYECFNTKCISCALMSQRESHGCQLSRIRCKAPSIRPDVLAAPVRLSHARFSRVLASPRLNSAILRRRRSSASERRL